MHDIDSTMSEFESEMDEYEGEYESEYEPEFEAEMEFETAMPFDEAEEMRLAAELLEVTDDEELEQFLGSLIKKAGRAIGKFARSSVGRSLGKILKGVAKKALPVVGGALGSFVAPGVGTAIGSSLGSTLSRAFEMELEGLDQDEMEFEAARRFVRIAGTAAQKAATAPARLNPNAVAKAAVKSAVKTVVPGVAGARTHGSTAGGRSGRWVRRGRKIVVLGV